MMAMKSNAMHIVTTMIHWLLVAALALSLAPAAHGKKKKQAEPAAAPQPQQPVIDTSKLVWPQPPDIARIRWLSELNGEPKPPEEANPKKKKQGWMDRLAGLQQQDFSKPVLVHYLAKPYGVAVDSKGLVYVADSYVGAVFIFNTETKKVEFIRNGAEAHFKTIIGVALDDNDRLFVTDAALHQVSVFDANHKFESVFGTDELGRPGGAAIDRGNRFLYVVDTEKEHVAVFDADTFKLLRTIGGPAKSEGDEDPGVFAKPTNVTIDPDGNVYVADTINNRIQIFDADGRFISMFGKAGDGPGFFERPKGVAVDGDGHIWVADATQGRVQIFDKEGHLLAYFGFPGTLTGQLGLPTGIVIDKLNRVIVTEQLKGRIQVFRYVTETEASAERAEREKRAAASPQTASQTAEVKK
jgi:DNA-binding beta-propeller fold protein YncE